MAERKSISKKLRFEVFKRDSFTCQYCGRMAPDVVLEVDHIKPVASGGTNELINLITSCFDCNRGKGKREISQKDEIKKQQEQLKQLNERREQLEFLIQWKEELTNFDNEQVSKIEKYFFKITKSTFTDTGRANIKREIKKYGFQEVFEATQIAIDTYYKINDDKTIGIAFSYIGKICANRKSQKENPTLIDINYFIKIAKNNLYYCNAPKLKRFLLKYYEESDNENIKNIFCDSRNWSILIQRLNSYYDTEELYGN